MSLSQQLGSPLSEPEPSPASVADLHRLLSAHDDDDEDADTASQRSISLSSPPSSPKHPTGLAKLDLLGKPDRDSLHDDPRDAFNSKRESHTSTFDTDFASEGDGSSMFRHSLARDDTDVSPNTSAPPSIYGEDKDRDSVPPMVYPPSSNSKAADDTASISSFASGSSRKARPESLLVNIPHGPLILGVALVDFNHLIGPRIEFSKGEIMEDEEVAKILPFLALPDGAHLSAEDYSYFHLVPPGPNPTTIFGISCNQQIAASALLVKSPDVTRSIVQKAVVVLASKPVFGPIRAKLGVVTTALFNQRDFTDQSILDDFATSLELSIRGQLTESGLYMGTSIRELVHTFRQRTLVLVKALMLQKRIMFYGHPVERLCTFQYSLVSLLPGLLQTLDDCGSPPLATRAPTLQRATSLRTSDHKSMMAYMGLPLDIFGKDAFFQPYLPLQQLDLLKDSKSWLCGCTNSIVLGQNGIDLLVNLETGAFEFRDPRLERSAGLTAADRKWMDDIIHDVNEAWTEGGAPRSMQFKGSDDYLRSKFEEYIFAALSSVRYQEFVAKGEGSGAIITGGSGGDSTSTEDFNPFWISEFKKTNAYEVWNRVTDPALFDIVEPRHPCTEKPSVVADIGIRLQEGIQDLRLEQQLAPAREAVARTLTAGSAGFFNAVEGLRGRWAGAAAPTTPTPSAPGGEDAQTPTKPQAPKQERKASLSLPLPLQLGSAGLKPFSLLSRSASESSDTTVTPTPGATPSLPPAAPHPTPVTTTASPATGFASPSRQSLGGWGAGFGSFLSGKLARRGSSTGEGDGLSAPGSAAGSVGPSPVPSPVVTVPPSLDKDKEGGEQRHSLSSLMEEDRGLLGETGLKRKEKEVEEPVTPTPWISVTSPGGTTPAPTPIVAKDGTASPTTPTAWKGLKIEKKKGVEPKKKEEEAEEEEGFQVVDVDLDDKVSPPPSPVLLESKKESGGGLKKKDEVEEEDRKSIRSTRSKEEGFNEEDAYTGMAL